MSPTSTLRPSAPVPYLAPADVDGLRGRAAELWRLEPAVTTTEQRTELLLRLHGVRLDLEALERRLLDGRVGPEDEGALVLCAVRLDELAEHWHPHETGEPQAVRREDLPCAS